MWIICVFALWFDEGQMDMSILWIQFSDRKCISLPKSNHHFFCDLLFFSFFWQFICCFHGNKNRYCWLHNCEHNDYIQPADIACRLSFGDVVQIRQCQLFLLPKIHSPINTNKHNTQTHTSSNNVDCWFQFSTKNGRWSHDPAECVTSSAWEAGLFCTQRTHIAQHSRARMEWFFLVMISRCGAVFGFSNAFQLDKYTQNVCWEEEWYFFSFCIFGLSIDYLCCANHSKPLQLLHEYQISLCSTNT